MRLTDLIIQVIGRGLQIFLSLISCFVFAQYITATMAVSPVSYATYSTVFFRIGPNAASIFTLLRDFIFYRALDSKFAMVWMILSASFVAAFPTWVSAMSGYSGNSGAFIKDVNGNFVSFSEFEYIEYVVHDGDRIGLNKDYYVTGNFSTEVGIRGKAHSTLALYVKEANMREILGTPATGTQRITVPVILSMIMSHTISHRQTVSSVLIYQAVSLIVQPTVRQSDL